ncbi:MAG: adenylyltransferase/cytidyltransferase family protein, partial [Spirochaetaceae bacterium]|nr:adenylyltransferase/cytidyltransferase family protein [Spirochaetaceae bacterium]
MKKVITYGTFDLLHHGHLNLLRRAKALGDYLIVCVTTDSFDIERGKLLVQQSLIERIAAVKATGIADEVILEEYEGQKIDDIKKYNVDIFAIGSDWVGKFDYILEFCKVVYLPRTKDISSTEKRNEEGILSLGIVGYDHSIVKFIDESNFISGIEITSVFCLDSEGSKLYNSKLYKVYTDYEKMLLDVDAVYIISAPNLRVMYTKKAFELGKHVLCETPVALKTDEVDLLNSLAKEKKVIFCEALKTAYSLAFQRLGVLLKTGIIGNIKDINATCTSLDVKSSWSDSKESGGGAIVSWGPYVLLPVLKILGCQYKKLSFVSYLDDKTKIDLFTNIQLVYSNSLASVKVGSGVKAEGAMIIAGTKGYVYVPAPWWKMDYFEIRYEDSRSNKKYFYQFKG